MSIKNRIITFIRSKVQSDPNDLHDMFQAGYAVGHIDELNRTVRFMEAAKHEYAAERVGEIIRKLENLQEIEEEMAKDANDNLLDAVPELGEDDDDEGRETD